MNEQVTPSNTNFLAPNSPAIPISPLPYHPPPPFSHSPFFEVVHQRYLTQPAPPFSSANQPVPMSGFTFQNFQPQPNYPHYPQQNVAFVVNPNAASPTTFPSPPPLPLPILPSQSSPAFSSPNTTSSSSTPTPTPHQPVNFPSLEEYDTIFLFSLYLFLAMHLWFPNYYFLVVYCMEQIKQ
jgi:hypothetical protein